MESELNAIISWLTKLGLKVSVWNVENRDKHESWKSSKIGDCRHKHGHLSWLSTASGSGIGPLTVGPAKVKACKSVVTFWICDIFDYFRYFIFTICGSSSVIIKVYVYVLYWPVQVQKSSAVDLCQKPSYGVFWHFFPLLPMQE